MEIYSDSDEVIQIDAHHKLFISMHELRNRIRVISSVTNLVVTALPMGVPAVLV